MCLPGDTRRGVVAFVRFDHRRVPTDDYRMRLELGLSARWGEFRLEAELNTSLCGVTALFGPSGSGKSTTLAAIAGFRPGLGRVAIDGVVWQDARRNLPPHRRPVGTVFQNGRLFDHLDVAGNLAFAARRADRDGPEITLDQVIDSLGLGSLLGRRTSTLSGGESQRVAIARALLTRPKLMLMDEPLSGLDRARKADLLPMIADLPGSFGLPVLFVSHQLDEIAQIADSLIAMRGGTFAGHGPIADMIENMDAALTGRFEAGSLLEGPVVRLDQTYAMAAIDIAGAALWMPDVGAATLGDRLRVRIRARDVSIATSPVEGLSIRNRIPATVTGVETDDGAFAEVRLDCAGQHLRARISRMAVAELGLSPGQEVWALIKSISFDRRLNRG